MLIPSVNVKAGILNTIAKSIYSDIRIKTREAVSNSIDNKADFFIITVDQNARIISFYDNGKGISEERFKEIFKSIGYGETRGNTETNSYFGLGLMSILQLGNKAVILSKSDNDDKVNIYTIETGKIFSEDMEKKSVDSLNEFISINELLSPREELSPLNDEVILKYNNNIMPDTFTEIILQDVDDIVINKIINEENYVKQLRRILPLSPDYSDPFFSHIIDQTSLDYVKEILNHDEYCKTIKVFYGNISNEEGYRELNKYYPEFIQDITFSDADIRKLTSKDKSFIGYILISSQDIGKPDSPKSSDDDDDAENKDIDNQSKEETGFWVRNNNFLVKPADFFQRPGGRKKIIDEPLKRWVYGEIFHKNMNKMLVVTRDEYLWDSQEFKDFYDELEKKIKGINTEYREIWKRGKKVVAALVEPFEDIKKNGMFKNLDQLLIKSKIVENPEGAYNYLQKISEGLLNPAIEDYNAIIENKLKESKSDLTLAYDVEGDIKVVVSQKKLIKSYIKTRDSQSKNLVIKISPDIFSSFRTNFLGKSFEVHYVLKEDNLSDISININNQKIFLNLLGKDIYKYRLTFVEYIIMAKIAHMESNDKDEMYRILLDLIGSRRFATKIPSIQPGEILSGLSSILNRM